ncbi:phage virion morphogenesis protein [Lentisphaerota bacterium WC36G]|nr:phage virion morphogenesis protein [Lentisphaerae bacterium WC36]
MSNITFDLQNVDSLLHNMSRLKMKPRERKLYVSRIARMVIAQAKKNVKEQKNVDGSPMEPRKRKPPKQRAVYNNYKFRRWKKTHKKMFVDMVKSSYLRVKADDWGAVVSFGKATMIAERHHYGSNQHFSLKINESLFSGNDNKLCNEEQAKELVRCGYLVNGVFADPKLIQKMITVRYAKKFVQDRNNDSWNIPTPKRQILGVTEKQVENFGIEIMNSMCEKFSYKNHEHLLK